MKAKPIFVVGLPDFMPAEGIADTSKNISNMLKDYHVLMYDHPGDSPEFQCFYEKDFNEVKYEELKEIIKQKIKDNE